MRLRQRWKEAISNWHLALSFDPLADVLWQEPGYLEIIANCQVPIAKC